MASCHLESDMVRVEMLCIFKPKSLLTINYIFFFLLFFSLNTPPGTKVKLLGTLQIKNGFVLLDDSNISVLGGEVDHMLEKWEIQRVRDHFIMLSQLLSP